MIGEDGREVSTTVAATTRATVIKQLLSRQIKRSLMNEITLNGAKFNRWSEKGKRHEHR